MNEQALNTAHVIAALVAKNDLIQNEHEIDKARLANLRDDNTKKEGQIAHLLRVVENHKEMSRDAVKSEEAIYRRAELYKDDIHKLSLEIEQLKANPPVVIELDEVVALRKENEELKFHLRNIRDAVLANTKDV
jgi:hypothetical protein